MIPFSEPGLSDKGWVVPLLQGEGLALCDYSFPVLSCWRETYQFQIAPLRERLLVHLQTALGSSYLWPAGIGDPAPAVEALRRDAAQRGEPLRLVGLTEEHGSWLSQRYPGQFALSDSRDGYNYLYETRRLAELKGKKLHAKRNHIHRFEEACPNWVCAPLTDRDIPDCLAMEREWYAAALLREGHPDSLTGEHRAITQALTHRTALGLEGVILREAGKLLAFSLGAPLTETVFDVHFERAWGELPGAYAMVNRAFARWVQERYPAALYLNREDDMGLPGLRKAKLSYHPDKLLVYKCAIELAAES